MTGKESEDGLQRSAAVIVAARRIGYHQIPYADNALASPHVTDACEEEKFGDSATLGSLLDGKGAII